MKTSFLRFVVFAICLGFATGCAKKQSASSWSLKQSEVSAQMKSFVAEKAAQAGTAAKADGQELLPEYKTLFGAAAKGNWPTIQSAFRQLSRRAPQYAHGGTNDERLTGIQWGAVLDTYGAFECFAGGDDKYCVAFGRDIINSIPPGSIYFGGTDPGRFLVTALEKSQVKGDPFFTLTQNALADGGYLEYLRSMYADKIYIPTAEDSQKAFKDYTDDARKRLQNHQLKSGEDVKIDPGSGKVEVSGQVAVMEINGLLAKIIFEKNTNQQFYVEESFPLDWMYPYLEPHDLIMKINQSPTELSDEVVHNDQDYWTKYTTPMIGGWLNSDTPVADIAAFVDKIYVKKDLSGFTGDTHFIHNSAAQKMFSKLRSSIGGLYAWRAQHTTDYAEKQRMNDAADFAFRQAWALCPYSPEAVFRYVNLLMSENKSSDALLVAETAAKMPGGAQFRVLVNQLKRSAK
jgi:hypothetical protein